MEGSIKNFYGGAEIFITGGSGFLGRVLIEKLLRSCDRISKIYLLMRSKKGVEAKKRIEKLTDCMVRNEHHLKYSKNFKNSLPSSSTNSVS